MNDGLAVNLLLLDAVQVNHATTLDLTGVHLLGGEATTPRGATDSFFRVLRFS